eukprot:7731051-Pyramimonas_sp.AAC.1
MSDVIRMPERSACGKQYKRILLDKGAPLECTSSPQSARATLTSPICAQGAPVKLAVRKPSGPIQ